MNIKTNTFGRQSSAGNIYVSLTTIPPRIEYLEPVLQGWAAQTIKPSKIFLTIPEYSKRFKKAYTLPSFLFKAEYKDILEVIRCEDFGPATKIIPVVQKFFNSEPDCKIIFCDDEWVFSPDTVENYLFWSDVFPDSALGLRGALLQRYRKNRGLQYNLAFNKYCLRFRKWRSFKYINGNELTEPREVQHLVGWKSCLVKPRFFTQALWDYSKAPEVCFFVDDSWISAHLFRNNVLCRIIPGTWPVPLAEMVPGEKHQDVNKTVEVTQLRATGDQIRRNKITWEYVLNSRPKWRSIF